MSATPDCEAIEKGLKDIIFSMSNGGGPSTNLFPITAPTLIKSEPRNTKLPFPKLPNETSELIDLHALEEFTSKRIEDPKELPHPDLEEDCQGVSALFEEIQNSPNFSQLPQNPLSQQESPKRSPFPRKKRKKKRGNKQKDNASFMTNVKVLEKENKGQKDYIKLKKINLTLRRKEYSLHMEKDNYRFQCFICSFNTDKSDYLNNHLISKSHLTQKEMYDKEMMLPYLPEPLPEQLEAITLLIMEKVLHEGLSTEDLNKRRELGTRFSSFVQDVVPICSTHLIGSSVTGIGLSGAEVDFVVKVENEEVVPDALEALYEALKKNSTFEKVFAKFKQKRPAILFVDGETKLSCNILIDNHSSLKIAELLSAYCKLDNRVQVLGAFIRYWAKMCRIDDQECGTLPAYSIALMLVYFFQQVQPPVLPVLHEDENYNSTTEYYEHYLKQDKWKSENKMSMGELWLKFLRFYVFDFKVGERIVCIRTSKNATCLERNWTTKFYAIEDPFLKRNVAYVIPSFQMCEYIHNCFLRTYRYFAYPQGTTAVQLLKTKDFDALKFSECADVSRPPGEVESEASENEDELEDHDPDIPVENFISTLANLSIKEEVKQEKPICYWSTNGKTVPQSEFSYQMDKVTFKGDKVIPIMCTMCKKKGHFKKDCPIEELPIPVPLPAMTEDYMTAITETLLYIYEENSVSQSCFEGVEEDMLDIEKSIKKIFPDAKLHLFGSFCNGFGFKDKSDMDFCLTFAEHEDAKELDSTDVIRQVAKQLSIHPRLENVVSITSAKVPIVKFQWRETKLEGDISLYNTLALKNTKMLEMYSKIDKRVQILGYALKYFAKKLGICDASRGSLSSYAYILMVLYFLQQRYPPVIPVLQELHGATKPVHLVDDWNVWYFEDLNKLETVWPEYGQNKESLGKLWLGLLCFYACEFDWTEYVISIKQKKLLRRFTKLWISDELAIEAKGKRISKPRKRRRKSSWEKPTVAIEDPFDLHHNLGGGLSRKMNAYILKAFIKGRERFGTPMPADRLQTFKKTEFVSYLFNRSFLNSGCEPPHDRGCGNCGKIGHLRKDCPQEKTCSYCRKPGHLIRNCPKKRLWQKEQDKSKDRFRNYDNLGKRGMNDKIQNHQKPHPLMRGFPSIKPHGQQPPIEAQNLIQMGVPMHRMPPPPGFINHNKQPPPGFMNHSNPPPNFKPPFGSSMSFNPRPKIESSKGGFRSPRQGGYGVERHPNPQILQGWQGRPPKRHNRTNTYNNSPDNRPF